MRSRIAAIPQEPILFSGTIRSNVDPYDHHEDHEIWTALERADLKARPENPRPQVTYCAHAAKDTMARVMIQRHELCQRSSHSPWCASRS